uniref:Uncharacterized protein n=1 Tax=Salarias fasciatus TaxID=181472 RepID=A0A672HF17_SALFA
LHYDLRKRLSFTAHKLEMVESEFDSTRQYLETELRRAQEELEKFSEKLRRIQSSYAALQRINQDLEDKMQRTAQHHEEEKRALSREIIVLNNHLMEAKLTINKLRDDNDVYRKDCNLAAQLLQCSKSHYRVHKMSELPLDFQERLSSHMEKHSGRGAAAALCHSGGSDAVPTAIIAQVLEKPEPGSSCPVTRSPSPQPQDGDFPAGVGGADRLSRRTAYKTSDLYCSDTALYCPERWQDGERRQSVDLHGPALLQLHAHNSTDSNPEEDAFPSGSFSHHEPPTSFSLRDQFGATSPPASSSYSSFSLASDEKTVLGGGGVRTASSTLSSSHQGLYMDWRDGGSLDYELKSMSSYDKDGSCFPKTASCFSDPFHSSAPRLASSRSMGSTTGLSRTHGGGPDRCGGVREPEDDLSGRWRQLSVEDITTFSSAYRGLAGRVSPYSFSEHHFATGPPDKVKGAIYSSFQEADVLRGRPVDRCFSLGSPRAQGKASALYGASRDSQDSESSLFLKDPEGGGGAAAAGGRTKDYVSLSPDSSAESSHHGSPEASSLQHYPAPRPSVRPRTGLTRKDSLTKAQLYGTLLN